MSRQVPLSSTPKKIKPQIVIGIHNDILTPKKKITRKIKPSSTKSSQSEYCLACRKNLKLNGIRNYLTLKNDEVYKNLKGVINNDTLFSRCLRICKNCYNKCISIKKLQEKLETELYSFKANCTQTLTFLKELHNDSCNEATDFVISSTKRMAKFSPIRPSVFKKYPSAVKGLEQRFDRKRFRGSINDAYDGEDDDLGILPLSNMSIDDDKNADPTPVSIQTPIPFVTPSAPVGSGNANVLTSNASKKMIHFTTPVSTTEKESTYTDMNTFSVTPRYQGKSLIPRKQDKSIVTPNNLIQKSTIGKRIGFKQTKVRVETLESSTPRSRILEGYPSLGVKYIALKMPGSAIKFLYEDPIYKSTIQQIVIKHISSELESLCSTKEPSILRNISSEDLQNLRLKDITNELLKRTPLFYDMIRSSVNKVEDSDISISSICSTILHARNLHMSAFSHKTGLFLRQCGANRTAVHVLSKMKITSHPSTIRDKLMELGQDHDVEVFKWKEAVEETITECSLVNDISKCLDDVRASEELQHILDKNETTITIINRLKTDYKEELITNSLEKIRRYVNNTAEQNGKLLLDTYQSNLKKSIAYYQIIGDNLDMNIPTRHKTTTHGNNSFHWFNMYAVLDPVAGNHLSNKHERFLNEVPLASFLPTTRDVQSLEKDFIVLCARILVKRLPQLKELKKAVVYHIPHRYQEEMSRKSQEIPLGILPKNENLNEDMIDIEEEVQEKYGLRVGKDIGDFIFFGGDQLTEERARNMQFARFDGRTMAERLQGLWPKHEDWHGIRIAYEAVIKMHCSKEAVTDTGTYFSNAVKCGNTNALMDVCDNYQKVKEFFQTENEALLVSAFLIQEGVDDINDPNLDKIIPANIKKDDVKALRRWFHGRIHKLLNESVISVMEQLPQLGSTQPITLYHCTEKDCDKAFTYKESRDLHEKEAHKKEFPEKIKEVKKKTSDDLYEWSYSHLGLGLLLHNADDAIKEGDGDRLIRVWDFLIYLFKINGNTKYALAGLRLKAARLALLSPQRAHQLTWNRFVNTHGVQGKCISRDLRLEHINKVQKMLIKSQGFQNINDENVRDISKSIKGMEALLKSQLDDSGILKRTGHHSNKHQHEMFRLIFTEIHDNAHNFSYTAGRQLVAFPNFDRNLFSKLDSGKLFKWIKKHRDNWHNQNLFYYNFI